MSDRHQLEEVTGAVSLGVLAEEMVLAVGRLRREEQLTQEDLRTIEAGQRLLEELSSAVPGVLSPGGTRHMDTEAAILDVYRAVRLRAPEEPAREFLARLAKPLARATQGDRMLSDQERALLPEIQALFTQIGELSLARTNELFDKGRKEPFAWSGSARSSAS